MVAAVVGGIWEHSLRVVQSSEKTTTVLRFGNSVIEKCGEYHTFAFSIQFELPKEAWTVSQFSALGLRKVTTVSHISPSWRLVLVDFARGVVRMLVSGSLSLPAKRRRLQRLSPVAGGIP